MLQQIANRSHIDPSQELRVCLAQTESEIRSTQVCGEPACDPDFNTADLLLLSMSRTSSRYARHLLERQD